MWVLALWECKRMILRQPEGRPDDVIEAGCGATKNEGREITRSLLKSWSWNKTIVRSYKERNSKGPLFWGRQQMSRNTMVEEQDLGPENNGLATWPIAPKPTLPAETSSADKQTLQTHVPPIHKNPNPLNLLPYRQNFLPIFLASPLDKPHHDVSMSISADSLEGS